MRALKQYQGGATLIIALIFLVVLTVVALSGMQTASTEIQTARRVKSQLDVFNAAEESLKFAEDLLQNNYADPVDFYAAMPADGLYLHSDIEAAVTNLDNIQALLNSASVSLSSATTSSADTQGWFFIEYMGPLATSGNGSSTTIDRYLYRVTAVGQQTSGGQRKMVQSYFVTSP